MSARYPQQRFLRGREPGVDQLALFAVMWALAHGWHLIGNPGLAPAWSELAVAAGVAAVLLRPGAVAPLAALAVAGLVSVWMEAPTTGNHWVLAGFVNLAVLVAAGVGVARRRPWDRADLANRLLPAARLCLVGFYAFAAFAKLNSGFFDRSVSCAVVFWQQSTASLGLGQLGAAGWSEPLVIAGSAAVELAVPVLLVLRRTRHLGVLAALVFHLVLALDRSHQFFDFSSVLIALLVLFLPASAGTWVSERVGSVRARLALRRETLPELAHLGAAGGITAVLVAATAAGISYDQGVALGWAPFLLYGGVVTAAALRYLRQERPAPGAPIAPHHPAFLVVPLLVLANGLTPYLELKTGYGWQMYSNLRTVDGDSNHFLVRATLPLTDELGDVVRVIDSDDPGLRWYVENDFGLTWRQLRAYVSERPEIAITYERAGEVVSLDRAADRPELVEPVPAWRQKLQPFRSVDLEYPPERCARTFGPAG